MLRIVSPLRVALIVLALAASAPAQSPSYSTLYNPLNVWSLNFEMDPADWAIVAADTTREIEKPAWFWADGESKILVSVRRKGLDVTGEKFGLKIDINEYFGQNTWHGVKKLSLEADASDVLSEGIAWYLYRQAATLPGDNFQPGLASWANVTVNGGNIGVYANVEHVDTRFLRNRDLWVPGDTWLYKNSDLGPPTLEEGPSQTSPTKAALNYSPFTGNTAPPAGYEAQLQTLIDMKGMLTLAAVEAFTTNDDALFSKGKNFWFADFEDGKRLYFPWDLDAVFKSKTQSIYLTNTAYRQRILANATFRPQYNQIMLDLLNGPMSVAELTSYVNALQAELTPWLLNDPNLDFDDIPGRFNELRTWLLDRRTNVLSQVQANIAAGNAVPEPSSFMIVGASFAALAAGRRKRSRR